jgi:hypothetical protein
MSIWKYLFDSDWQQRSDIEDLAERSGHLADTVRGARYSAQQLKEQVRELQNDVAELALFNQTLLRVLVQKGLCTPEEFKELFTQIDLEDGTQDGQITEKPTNEAAKPKRELSESEKRQLKRMIDAEAQRQEKLRQKLPRRG